METGRKGRETMEKLAVGSLKGVGIQTRGGLGHFREFSLFLLCALFPFGTRVFFFGVFYPTHSCLSFLPFCFFEREFIYTERLLVP